MDAPKNGYRFSDEAWKSFLRNWKYPTGANYPRKPAYKDPSATKASYQRAHIVDFLKFDVVIPSISDFNSKLEESFEGVKPDDDDLEGLYATRYSNACIDKEVGIRKELEDLIDTLDRLVQEWDDVRRI